MSKKLPEKDCKAAYEEDFLKDDSQLDANEKVVVVNHVPEYRKIIFINNRDPGQTLYFHYKSKTHPLKHYTLAHGLEYNLPLEIIQHLEGQNDTDPYSCHERQYGTRKNYEGLPENYVASYKPYYQCRTAR